MRRMTESEHISTRKRGAAEGTSLLLKKCPFPILSNPGSLRVISGTATQVNKRTAAGETGALTKSESGALSVFLADYGEQEEQISYTAVLHFLTVRFMMVPLFQRLSVISGTHSFNACSALSISFYWYKRLKWSYIDFHVTWRSDSFGHFHMTFLGK